MGLHMPWEAWFTLAVVAGIFIVLVRESLPTDVVMIGALTMLVAIGEFFHSQLLPEHLAGGRRHGQHGPDHGRGAVRRRGGAGANRRDGAGRRPDDRAAQDRPVRPAATVGARSPLLSAFLNNTPVVAMFMPVVEDICKRSRISPSKLYLPMAYAATFGGVCTLVGTSTNLIVQGLLPEHGHAGMRMFDLAWIGIPCAIAGVVYFMVFGQWLLPDRRPAITTHDDPREYTVEMMVLADGAARRQEHRRGRVATSARLVPRADRAGRRGDRACRPARTAPWRRSPGVRRRAGFGRRSHEDARPCAGAPSRRRNSTRRWPIDA